MTYVGSVIALFRPFYGFLIYVCFSLIRPESLWHWSVPAGNYSRIIAIALLIGWALSGFGNWNLGQARRPAMMLIGFWLWALVSTVFCEFPEIGIKFLENIGKIVLPAIVGLTLINSRKEVYQLAWTIVGSFGYVAYDLNRSYFDGYNRLQDVGFGGMDNNSLTIGLVTGVGIAFFLGLSEAVWWRRYAAFAAAAFLTHAVLFSFSRGGMLGLIVVGLATAVLIPKNPKNLALMGLGVIVGFAMAGPQVWERFSQIKDTSVLGADSQSIEASAESRIQLWGICLRMLAESPVVGKGPDNYVEIIQRYTIALDSTDHILRGKKEAHTLWLQTAAELGVPGVSFLLLFYFLTITRLYPYAKMDQADGQGMTQGATARMVIAALAGFMVSAQFVSLEGLEIPYYVAICGLGSLKLATTTELDEDELAVPIDDLAVEPQHQSSPVM